METTIGCGGAGLVAEQQTPESLGSTPFGSGEQAAQGGRLVPGLDHHRVKKRDALGLKGGGRLMDTGLSSFLCN